MKVVAIRLDKLIKNKVMKILILFFSIMTVAFSACNSNKSNASQQGSHNMQNMSQTDSASMEMSSMPDADNSVSIKEIISSYLVLKSALTEDNSAAAAKAGGVLHTAFKNFNKTSLTADQKKIFEEVEEDAIEHAEHIAENGGNIAHQREHFDILSKDIYDLVKNLGGGRVLYKISDQMYNKGKGAFWLSETKEIRNPYMGKAMLNSGTIQEEIK
jgi:hypothetical protein